ncbi:hypothetical protein Pelo_16980 [Pelomyxa schiedti]|nr:hypothetical protein Pelo_16980 [Pelomyxa schiedti]
MVVGRGDGDVEAPIATGELCFADEWDAKGKWAVTVTYNRNAGPGRGAVGGDGCGGNVNAQPLVANVTVVSLKDALGVRGCVSPTGARSCCFVCVTMPIVVAAPVAMRAFIDPAADGEAIITQDTTKSVVVFVVDLEQTYKSRSLVVLSKTTWDMPIGHLFLELIVLRGSTKLAHHSSLSSHRQQQPDRIFIVTTLRNQSTYRLFQVEELTCSSEPLLPPPGLSEHTVDKVHHLTGSLFCLTSHTSDHKETQYAVYHCDDVTHPIMIQGGLQGSIEPVNGLIITIHNDRIEATEPTTRRTVLTIHFPSSKWLHLVTKPFSCFLSSSL